MKRSIVWALVVALGLGGQALAAGSKKTSPEDQAKRKHNKGVELSADGDAARKMGDVEAAGRAYERAQRELEQAVRKDASYHPAWNQLGYVRRMLGDLPGSLQAYDRALELDPDFAQAIEYRGETYLGLGRLEDAKAAHARLSELDPELAGDLESAMSRFVVDRSRDPGDLDPDAVTEFTRWLSRQRRKSRKARGSYSGRRGGY